MLDQEAKKNLRAFGIFLGIFVVMTGILVFSILYSKSSKKKLLANDVQVVLNNYAPDTYIVGEFIELKSGFSTSGAAYSLLKVGSNAKDTYQGLLVRIPTLFGPMPAVFICKNGSEVEFAGYAVDLGRAKNAGDIKLSVGIINYWKENVPKILGKAISK